MASGAISLLDAQAINTTAYTPHAVHIGGNVFAVVSQDGTDIRIQTISIDTAGNITLVDTWNTGLASNTQFLIHISGTTFALAYSSSPSMAGIVKTFSISAAGAITKSWIATHTFAAGGAAWVWIRCEPVSCGGNVWAIGCQDSPGIEIYTISISDDGLTISTADKQDYAISQNKVMSMANVRGNIYALVTEQLINPTTLYTFEIDAGAITAKDSAVIGAADAGTPGLFKITDGIIGICHNTNVLETRPIAADGTIGAQIDVAVEAERWYNYPLGGNIWVYQIGNNVYTRSFTDAGAIGAVIDTQALGLTSIGTHCHLHGVGNMWASFTSASPTLDLYALSLYIVASSLPSDSMARVTGIRHIYRPGMFRMVLSLGDVSNTIEIAEAKVRKELELPEQKTPDIPKYEPAPEWPKPRAPEPSRPAVIPTMPGVVLPEEVFKKVFPEYEPQAEPPTFGELLGTAVKAAIPSPVRQAWRAITPWKEEAGETFGGEVAERFKAIGKFFGSIFK